MAATLPPTNVQPPAVSMSGIRIAFGKVVANDAVDLEVRPGEIHALLGENGAGKTTLMRALSGLLQPDAGAIRLNGQPVVIRDPQTAQDLGIGMVHQHFMLIETMTVAENMSLGLPRERAGGRVFFPDFDRVAREVDALGRRHDLQVDASARVGSLTVAGQQRVEILKALHRGARVLILDEPTAVLSPQESLRLFAVVRSLAEEGTAIIFISHKLHEVMAVTDRITVLRRGKVAGCLTTAETSEGEIARLMVGAVTSRPRRNTTPRGETGTVLRLRGAGLTDERGLRQLDGIDLEIGRSEILGVAGVDGNGQSELAEVVVGLQRLSDGSIELDGADMTGASPAVRIARGVAHVPEDRHRTALVPDMSVADNAVIEMAGWRRFARAGLRRGRHIAEFARELVQDYDVRPGDIRQPVGSLSGGNQQKLVMGRALTRDPKLIVAVQPARGLDFGATAFVHGRLLDSRSGGAAIMLISAEMDELVALCDRIVVMYRGMIIGEQTGPDYDIAALGLMMAGRAA
ncbi:ABC transporter ATP-binding protein [Tropicimonas sediminicola]|uniref:Nucleoside ABC transporter ATP-binding protein n=1 Tax=Tropicimonas sediminicola TaxID=1031541 RepID=A0A239DG35_9RHOB|nr:ABC transporter ATP-binding protein [Tropicimonas sediminicola]SNS31476.1 nucleoside ABC transporter ATP-binding protein [Tropicimonas sediminicola]